MVTKPNKKSLVSKQVNQISPSGIRRFFDLLASIEGVISLGVGEPDFATPWHMREAAIYSLEKGYTMYTSNLGMPELRQELSRYLEDNYRLEYDPNGELLITVGVSEALDLALRAILDPGDEVIMPDPCYVSYQPCVIMAGGTPVMVPAIARRHQLLVISDEIYARLVYGVEHTCFATLPGIKESTVLLGGFSKAYAMTGWRVGYAAATKEIISAMTKIHQYTVMCVPIMGQIAAIEALRSGEASAAGMVEEYNRRRLVMVKGLNDIGLPCFEPKGAFYAFPSIKGTGMASEEFAEKLLIEEKVAVVPGSAFGQCGEGYVRCCYAVSLADLEEALSRMGRFVKKYRKI
jgi:aminotransferase